jgi:hypothetical protein
MFVVHRVSRLQGRLSKFVVTFALAAVMPALVADAAQAATATAHPSIQGTGTISATSYSCSNFNTNDASIIGCPDTSAVASGLSSAVLTLTADPVGWQGNAFSHWEGCTSPLFATATVSGNTCTLTVPFFLSTSISPRAVFDDTVGPTVSSVTPVYSTTTDRGVSFSIGANELTSSRECSVDGGAFAACGTARAFSEGTRTVRARVTDNSGNVGGLSSATTFRVVDTALVSGPVDFSTVKRPTFKYSTIAGISFECRIVPAAFAPCGTKNASGQASFTPPSNLTDGTRTFQVRAVDGPEFDRVPISRTWTIDTVAPNTTLSSPSLPEGVLTTLLNASFSFGSTEPLGKLQCRLDGAASFTNCTSPKTLTDLAFGSHAFRVRAVDRAGNVDATPAVRNWTIAAKDEDGDGFNQRTDCNDANANINPARPEILDNDIDENCDGIKGVNLDRDNDGIQRPTDCDDSNPAIHPGAVDVPGNALDEDCVGGPAPKVRGVMNYTLGFSFAGSFTRFKPFTVNGAPIGAKVTVACKGKGCPKKKSFVVTKAKQPVKGYVNKKLRAGWVLTFTVKRSDFITGVKTLKIRNGKPPVGSAVKCLPPGAKKPGPCSASA